MKTILQILSIVLLCNIGSNAQEHNNAYVTAGTLVFLQSVNISYEKSLKIWKSDNKILLKTQVGWAGSLPSRNSQEKGFAHHFVPGVGIVYLWNIGNNRKIDFGMGTIMIIREDPNSPFPMLTAGYRKEHKSSLFRVGFGIPEGLYFSYGVRF